MRILLLFTLALTAASLVLQHGVAAATPAESGRYYGAFYEETTSQFFPIDATLAVSASGRSLSADSHIDYDFRCRGERSGRSSGRLNLRDRHARVQVSRDGSFSLRKEQSSRGPEVLAASLTPAAPVRFRLRGRFLGSGTVRIVYRVRAIPRRPRNRQQPGVCVSPREVATLYLGGKPPFSGCRSQPARNLVVGERGRVFAQWRFISGDGFFPHVFACSFETDLRISLGTDWDTVEVNLPTLAGSMVAYELHHHCCQSRIRVRDLRTGSVVHRLDEVNSTVGVGNINVRSLVVNESGSVAWIVVERVYGDSPQPDVDIQVWAVNSDGRRMLDSGAGIKPRSLTLSSSTLSWVNAGTVRAAPLD
jgi:hypothetical protein